MTTVSTLERDKSSTKRAYVSAKLCCSPTTRFSKALPRPESFFFMKRAHSIGVKVKLMKMEAKLMIKVAMANGLKNNPTMDVIMEIGIITTTLVPAEARTATATSPVPTLAASQGSSKSGKRLTIDCRTTMEFETRTPVDKPKARSVAVFSELPVR